MNDERMSRLSLDASFSRLRDEGRICVDKTDLVARMAGGSGKYAFFRPPRFGKTLLVSTFETLFQNGLRDFHGLKIEKLWKDKTYDVVRLDFSDVRRFISVEEYQRTFNELLIRSFGRAGFAFDPNKGFSVNLSSRFNLCIQTPETLLRQLRRLPVYAC